MANRESETCRRRVEWTQDELIAEAKKQRSNGGFLCDEDFDNRLEGING